MEKPVKRKIYHFKKANWDALNYELCHTNWNAILGCSEPEVAWSRFKSVLFFNVNKYIPTITIKSEFKPPWFDSESMMPTELKSELIKNTKEPKVISMV